MKNFSITLCLLLGVLSVWAQKSDLEGLVQIDGQEVAIGAYVILENTKYQTVTDIDGKFAFQKIPAGAYQLTVSYVGTETFKENITFPYSKGAYVINLNSSNETLETITISAKSQSREQTEQAIEIESIEIKELLTQIKDISEAIDQLSGVRIRSSGSFGDRADISINGLNGTAVRTYIDGLPLDFTYPHFSFNNLPIDNIKRVDVYKGVVPIDIGTDALGGGINIITQQKPFNEFKASYGYGSFDTHQANASLNYKIAEDVSINVNGTYNTSANNFEMEAFVWETKAREKIKRFHDDYKFIYGGTGIDFRNKSWADKFRIELNYGAYEKALQHGGKIGNFALGAVTYEGSALASFVTYEKSLGDKLSLSTKLAFSKNNVIYTDTTANKYSWSGAIINRNPNKRGEFGSESRSDRDFTNYINRINLKYQLSEKDEISLSNLIAYQNTVGRDEVKPIERDFLTKKQFLTKDIVGLQYQRKLLDDKLILAVASKVYFFKIQGIERFSESEISKSGEHFGYYTSLKYNFTDRFFVRASYESALRIPTFAQFFGNGINIISNLELKTESSDNINTGLSFRSAPKGFFKYGIEANAFLRGQNDIIYLSTGQFQQYLNAEDVRTIGIEGDFFVDVWDKLNLSFNVTRLKQTYESISDANIAAKFLEGTPFPNVPSFFTNVRLSYRLKNIFNVKNKLRVYAQHKFVDEFNFINVGQIYNPDNYVPVQHRVDAGLSYTGWDDRIIIGFNVNNILDAANFDNFSIPRPGWSFNAKVTYKLFDF